MIHPFSAARRRVVLLASGAAFLVAVAGGTTAAFAAAGDATPTPATPAVVCAVHLRAELLGAMPAQLRADLQTLRGEPKGAQRVAERTAIRAKALSGAYGARTERLAHVVAGARGAGRTAAKSLPAALQADLKTLRATEPRSAARKAEAAKIERQALAGDYGTTIATRAKTVQARFQQRCSATTAT